MNDYSVRAWTALNYLAPTFFPVRITRVKPEQEHRVCRGPQCIDRLISYRIETMFTGKRENGQRIYYCNACAENYRGEVELERCKNE